MKDNLLKKIVGGAIPGHPNTLSAQDLFSYFDLVAVVAFIFCAF